MARPDGRIEKGQRLSSAISARAWNRAQEAADRVLGARLGSDAGPIASNAAPYTWVYARNAAGSDVERWSVQSVTAFEIVPSSDETAAATRQFLEMPLLMFDGRASDDDTRKPWCVALEPIKAAAIGKVAVSGVVQIKTSSLNKASGCRVLFKNEHWALVDMSIGIIRCTFSGAWQKAAEKTVTDASASGLTYRAKNYFAALLNTGTTRSCAIAFVNGEWILVAAEC
jgi:hypothetical protein